MDDIDGHQHGSYNVCQFAPHTSIDCFVREAFKKTFFFHSMKGGGSRPKPNFFSGKKLFWALFAFFDSHFLTTKIPKIFHTLGGGGQAEGVDKSTLFFKGFP